MPTEVLNWFVSRVPYLKYIHHGCGFRVTEEEPQCNTDESFETKNVSSTKLIGHKGGKKLRKENVCIQW